MTWQCRRCGRTVDLVLRAGDRCAACAMRTRAGRTLPDDDGAADFRKFTMRKLLQPSSSSAGDAGAQDAIGARGRRRTMRRAEPSTRREVISGTLRHEGARRSRALRAVPPDVHLVPRRGNAGRAPVSRFEVDVTSRYQTQGRGSVVGLWPRRYGRRSTATGLGSPPARDEDVFDPPNVLTQLADLRLKALTQVADAVVHAVELHDQQDGERDAGPDDRERSLHVGIDHLGIP